MSLFDNPDLATKDALPSQSLDLFSEDQSMLGGFRLHCFAVLNWGTFDNKIWKMSPNSENALLTGNIGSGKSTLVDGLTTLLVPPRKVSFNKAAGAADKERSIESYFHGYYTSHQDETGKARAQGLRKAEHYSVLLAQFYSQALQQKISLAQVFWLKPGEKKVKRLFVVAEQGLQIETDFSGFGTQITQLKKQLRKHPGLQTFDSFASYQQVFSRLLGLGADGKALELFNQTISMKSVGSVTDFVRQNMLQTPDVELQLQELESSYDDLKRLHDAVVAARQKVQLLTPVSDYGERALTAEREKVQLNHSRDLSDGFVASLAVDLYQKRIEQRQLQLDKLEIELGQLEQQKQQHEEAVAQLNDDILNSGGGRIQLLETAIGRASHDRDDSRKIYNNYQTLTRALALSDTLDVDTFVANLNSAKELAEQLNVDLEALETEQDELKHQLRASDTEQTGISEQLSALKQRKSNIHVRQLNIRERLCQELQVDEERLPFVGELLQVKPDQVRWQGAIERVLHNFALSLIVPDDLYQRVCDFVEQTHLGTRLVYYRVKAVDNYFPGTAAGQSLLSKIEIKAESEHYQWLHRELQQRFDYQCCAELSDFRRSEKAISLNGQIKSGKFRHEKDDRHQLQDRSRYVLGWSNKEKISLLTAALTQCQASAKQLVGRINLAKQQRDQLSLQQRNAFNLAAFDFSFENLNWPLHAAKVKSLVDEKNQLELASDILRELRERLASTKQALTVVDKERDSSLTLKGRTESELEADWQTLAQQQEILAQLDTTLRAACFPIVEQCYRQHVQKSLLRIDMLSGIATQLRSKLNEQIQNLESKRRRAEQKMIVAMSDFAHSFANEVTELDQSLASLKEYQALLKRLEQEDLPRHEERFKQMLNRDTIRAMVIFRSHLDKQEEEIDARIHLINQSLRELDYQAGTYIQIDAITSPDLEIREFKLRLKSCAEQNSDDDLYSEQKFEQVKELIEQMRNQPKWTQKVVDVRYWHLFNVIERYSADDSEKECYSDSGGKSGGQKEKLAYSILAAAIMLQYGLVHQESGNSGKRKFNLVVIDEAFARGSKDSTRFGLELFKKLGLQLLLVTPLQKLDVIEHYVQHVHFVDQQNNRSVLLNMSIEEYRDKLAKHKSLRHYQHLVKEA